MQSEAFVWQDVTEWSLTLCVLLNRDPLESMLVLPGTLVAKS